MTADPGDRAVYGVDLQPFDRWHRTIESRWGREYSSHVFVLCW